MSDKKLNNIEHADQNLLEQMVTEALMRDKMETPDVDMEWKRLAARMTTPSAEVETTSRNERLKVRFFSNRTLWMTIGSVAAIAFIIFLISLNLDKATSGSLYEARKQYAEIVILDEQNHEQVINGNEIKLAPSVKVERHTVVVPEGKDMKLILADGTQVWLNANSRLVYPTAFKGKNREVELQGEGYFKVAHDAHHPFIVKAGDMNLT